jgi:hypothetical protein
LVAEVGFVGGGVAICCNWIMALTRAASISLYCCSLKPDDNQL